MSYDPFKHHRRSIRLQGYDYTKAGTYFVTLAAHHRECLFGDIADGEMRLNALGRIVAEEWLRSANIRKEIELDEWIVMPNHLHGIVMITMDTDDVGAHGRAPLQCSPENGDMPLRRPAKSLGSFIAGFKSATTKRIYQIRNMPGEPVWQRNYHDHIIRDENSLNLIRRYIVGNPATWADDAEHPS
jgi:putative transposase